MYKDRLFFCDEESQKDEESVCPIDGREETTVKRQEGHPYIPYFWSWGMVVLGGGPCSWVVLTVAM